METNNYDTRVSSSTQSAIFGSDPASQIISENVVFVNSTQYGETSCPICLCDLMEPGDVTVALVGCKHCMHLSCLKSMLSSQKATFIQCPVCQRIYGEKQGNQPPGTMTTRVLNWSLPGHENAQTIEITYSIRSGIQGPEHPKPGKPYHAVGFPRICYLPDTEKGRLVLSLLKVAFDRRLTFTIGRSVTTGRDDCVTWNEIHHKTEPGMSYFGHGYPDPDYLDNCLAELARQGVVPPNTQNQQLR